MFKQHSSRKKQKKNSKVNSHGFTIEQTDKELIISWRGYEVNNRELWSIHWYVLIIYGGFVLYSIFTQQIAPGLEIVFIFLTLSLPFLVIGIFFDVFRLNRIIVSDTKIRVTSQTYLWWGTREIHVDNIRETFVDNVVKDGHDITYKDMPAIKVRLQEKQQSPILMHARLKLASARFLVKTINNYLDK